ncbi:MAG: hypothetical protein HZB30_04810 [Nitrospirae bacterium]|nr:hypothetical protein [Nitrospirota bacterium]
MDIKKIPALKEILPKWTKRVVTETGGKDPLGLSRVSFIISDFLLTGIITTTDRARYYSFYCWSLWHIDLIDPPKNYQDFVDKFRRRESVIALATIANNPETSPVGVTAAKGFLEEGKDSNELNCDFRVLPSNALGGYGQYYAGSLYKLVLTYRPDDGIDRVTKGVAEDLAASFQDVINSTPYIKKRLFVNPKLNYKDLENSKKRLSLDAIMAPFASNERKKLIDIFFGRNKENENERTLFRRKTLLQVLYILAAYEKYGTVINLKDVDWKIVFSPYYYDVLFLDDQKVMPYDPLDDFRLCHSLWKQFCLHQFFIQVLEGIMYCVLEIVGKDGRSKIKKCVNR